MFIDMTGRVGAEHAREMRRSARALGFGRTGRRHHVLRGLTARAEIKQTSSTRSR